MSIKAIHAKHFTVLFLNNLVNLQWYSVPCDKKLTSVVYCSKEDNTRFQHLFQAVPSNYSCQSSMLLVKEKCHIFKWAFVSENRTAPHITTTQLKIIFDAVSEALPPILVTKGNKRKILTFTRLWNIYRYHYKSINQWKQKVLLVRKFLTENILALPNVFICSQEQFVSILSLCDGKRDCFGKKAADEEGCQYQEALGKNYSNKCKVVLKEDGKMSCSEFYPSSHSQKCSFFSGWESSKVRKPDSLKFRVEQNNCYKIGDQKTKIL